MNKSIKRIGAGLAGLALVVGAYKGMSWLYEQAKKQMQMPTIEAVDKAMRAGEIGVFELEFPRTRKGYSILNVIDEDGDGLADVFSYFGHAEWIAEEYTSKNYSTRKAKTMTSEMRDAASRMLQARRDLYFETWKKVYELEQEKR
ncbi:hypothetical protein J4462_02215 [Candidatus Pacearchaeota archaeon]|nr:hypothetical protein [Candidatus Pacearchaeota archaeon]